MRTKLFMIAAALSLYLAPCLPAQEMNSNSQTEASPSNPVEQVNTRLERGEIKLSQSAGHGYLQSVLQALAVPEHSQAVTFGKTSFHRDLISPANPRSIYFSRDVYVGFVHGAEVLEIAAADPVLGTVFYTLSQSEPQPRFIRNDSCLSCHESSATEGLPGLIVRSVFPDEKGHPRGTLGGFFVDDATPLEQRWGGWAVTSPAASYKIPHLGNRSFGPQRDEPRAFSPQELRDLKAWLKSSSCLQPSSEVAALLVLEHQCAAQNILARARQDLSQAAATRASLRQELADPSFDGQYPELLKRRAGLLCDLLLLKDFPSLRDSGLKPEDSPFAAAFAKMDSSPLQGLDLHEGLFCCRVSPMVYSIGFRALPQDLRSAVLHNMIAQLELQPPPAHLAGLQAPQRKTAIAELRRLLE